MMWYNDLNSALRRKYGQKVRKICLDAGMTCPNRDGRVGTGGCIFCGTQGAGENIAARGCTIAEQMDVGARRIRRLSPHAKYIAYFQNYSNTYAPFDALRSAFMTAAQWPDVVVLAVATRPDCISEACITMLADVQRACGIEIWVELGLQTSNDAVAHVLNRCCATVEFDRMTARLYAAGLGVVMHVLFGLPGESETEMLASVRHVARLPITGVKFHALYVMRDTHLASLYQAGQYRPLDLATYCQVLGHALAVLPPQIHVHRLASDCRADLLLAPAWCADRPRIRREILLALHAQNCVQGCAYD